jgi:dihydroorotate dehydrogenase electron transfer subunit
VVQPAPARLAGLNVLTLSLPPGLIQGSVTGRYFLARCGAQTPAERAHDWSVYARRPLFVVHARSQSEAGRKGQPAEGDAWTLALPTAAYDPGYAWLAGLDADATVNLLGPLGTGFTPPDHGVNLLLLADVERLPLLLSLIEPTLDRGGRVTALALANGDAGPDRETLLDLLPLAAELRLIADPDDLFDQLAEILTWADRLCIAMPGLNLARLAGLVSERRFRLEEGFAQVLIETDLVCGVGACLSCVVPLANGGLTRTCVHGPVLDLTRLVR